MPFFIQNSILKIPEIVLKSLHSNKMFQKKPSTFLRVNYDFSGRLFQKIQIKVQYFNIFLDKIPFETNFL